MNFEDIVEHYIQPHNEWLLLQKQGILHLVDRRVFLELGPDALEHAFTCDTRTLLVINDRMLSQASDDGFWKEVYSVRMPAPGESLTVLCLEVAYGSRLDNMGVYEPRRDCFHDLSDGQEVSSRRREK